MKDLIKCHFNYLVSKKTLLTSFVIVIIIMLSNISFIFFLDKSNSFLENNQLYFNNALIISRILLVFFSIFIFGYSFQAKVDQYVVLIISSNISRSRYLLSKIITISLYLFLFNYLIYFVYCIVGFIFYNYFYFNFYHLLAFLNLYITCLFFGLLSLICIIIFKNIYSIIIPFGLMNIGMVINNEKNKLSKIYNILIIYLRDNIYFYYGYLHIIIYLLFLFIIVLFIYDKIDIT